MSEPASILIDWGTTNFRAWLVAGGGGAVLDRRKAPRGIMQVEPGGFPAALDEQVGAWRVAHPGVPVLMSGMVGSRQVTLIGRPDMTDLYSSIITSLETATVSIPVAISTLHGLNHLREAMKNG